MQISKAVTGGTHVGLTDLAVVTAAGLALHGTYLAFNTLAARALKLGGAGGGQEGDLLLLTFPVPPPPSFSRLLPPPSYPYCRSQHLDLSIHGRTAPAYKPITSAEQPFRSPYICNLLVSSHALQDLLLGIASAWHLPFIGIL